MISKATLKVLLFSFLAAIMLHLPIMLSAQKSMNQNRRPNQGFQDLNNASQSYILNHGINLHDRLGFPIQRFGFSVGTPNEFGDQVTVPLTMNNIRGAAEVSIFSSFLGTTELEDLRVYSESQSDQTQYITFDRPNRAGPTAIIIQACTGTFRTDCLSRIIIVTVDGSFKLAGID
ncbi:MAG: hypothetical protein AAFV80_02915 [Bacteroidota bacterium]